MLIGLTGYAQTGKDTVADYLVSNFGFQRLAFADGVRELAWAENPEFFGRALRDWIVDQTDPKRWNVFKALPGARRYLQSVGQEQRLQEPTYWIKKLEERMETVRTHNIVITDFRYPNEVEWLRENGGGLWRIHRKGVGPANFHDSETLLNYFTVDFDILNSGTIDELNRKVDSGLLREVVKNVL